MSAREEDKEEKVRRAKRERERISKRDIKRIGRYMGKRRQTPRKPERDRER